MIKTLDLMNTEESANHYTITCGLGPQNVQFLIMRDVKDAIFQLQI